MSNKKKTKKFMDFIMGNNMDFYKTFLVKLSEEELEQFLKDNPEFLELVKKEKE